MTCSCLARRGTDKGKMTDNVKTSADENTVLAVSPKSDKKPDLLDLSIQLTKQGEKLKHLSTWWAEQNLESAWLLVRRWAQLVAQFREQREHLTV